MACATLIKAFAVFDLGGAQIFDPASLAQIDRPLLVFGAPLGDNALDAEPRACVAALPGDKTTSSSDDLLIAD